MSLPVSSSTLTCAPAAPWCQCEEAMPWPVSGSSPPSSTTSPKPRSPSPRSATATSSARPIMCVERLEVVRVSNGVTAVSGSGITTCPGSQPSSCAAMSWIERFTPWPISVEAERTTKPTGVRSIATCARLGVCIPLSSTHRPLPRGSSS